MNNLGNKVKAFDSESLQKIVQKKYSKISIYGDCNRPFTKYFCLWLPVEISWNVREILDMTEEEFLEYAVKRLEEVRENIKVALKG